jgi:Holliday junction resolvasome RuvABC DNA-binding subunit
MTSGATNIMRHQLNAEIAERLRFMAELRAQQGDNGFRVQAYRRAADTLESLEEPVDAVLAQKGRAGLIALEGVGAGIAAAIAEMVSTGRWAQLERLQGVLEPEQLFRSLPGIGPKLAARIHDELEIETLEQLEMAVHDGRLERVEGVGARRAASVRAMLNERLGGRRIRRRAEPAPSVAALLGVDAAYRRRAAAGELRMIAPRRFNPKNEPWLPVLHVDRGRWHFTALYSNTARAHQLGKSKDWVVLYFHTANSPESQVTIVTETRGPLKGRRVVRGREQECASHYTAKGSRAG